MFSAKQTCYVSLLIEPLHGDPARPRGMSYVGEKGDVIINIECLDQGP